MNTDRGTKDNGICDRAVLKFMVLSGLCAGYIGLLGFGIYYRYEPREQPQPILEDRNGDGIIDRVRGSQIEYGTGIKINGKDLYLPK